MAAAALSIGPLCHRKHKPILVCRNNSRLSTTVCCQNRDQNDSQTKKEIKEKQERLSLHKLFVGVERLQESLSPKRKGDWKDITLMCLSFAVYVYMSQKIVCAYCAWMSMPSQPW